MNCEKCNDTGIAYHFDYRGEEKKIFCTCEKGKSLKDRIDAERENYFEAKKEEKK